MSNPCFIYTAANQEFCCANRPWPNCRPSCYQAQGQWMPLSSRSFAVVLALVSTTLPFHAQTNIETPDIPPTFTAPKIDYDYVKRVEMVPMRDGVKLYTVIVIPKGATHAPILLTRTPYNAAGRT